MIALFLLRIANRRADVMLASLILIGIVGGACAFPLPYVSNSNVIIGLCLLPFSFFVYGSRKNNVLYLLLALAFVGLALVYHVRLFYFFALAFYGLWLVEFFVGACNRLVLFLVLFMSPVFSQASTILGFPLRLKLSECAGGMLRAAGLDVQVEGNIMLLNGATFSVDEACMGLNMLAISMLMGVFLLIHRYRADKKQLRVFHLVFFFTAVFLLNLMANLSRIIMLVFFAIGPDNPLHEIVGLLGLLVYVMVPLYFIGNFLMRRYGLALVDEHSIPEVRPWGRSMPYFLAAVVLITGIVVGQKRLVPISTYATVTFGDLPSEHLPDGITKVATEAFLLYVKPIPEFFTAEHSPLICWRGSGYDFSGIKEFTVNGTTIYRAKLVMGKDEFYTAWWYTNGQVHTISQFDWRMRMLKGEDKFCLVNISAKDETTLMKHVGSMFNTKHFSVGYGKE